MSSSDDVVRCYGITKDPETNNFMMVMQYADCGNLRQHLNNNFILLNWEKKLSNLYLITSGLRNIHNNKLIHRDFHSGNILCYDMNDLTSLISDLGLCKPANVRGGDKTIYGVLPYVAPEVLRGGEYTQASDIYGFGIIAYEICTGLPPYHDIPHDEFLAAKICQGLRPKSDYKIPQLILDIIQQCWDADPLKRPKAKEFSFRYLWENCKNISVLDKQTKEADEVNKKSLFTTSSLSTGILSYITHAQAVYTSRLLDFRNLPEPKNADNNDNSFETEYSGN